MAAETAHQGRQIPGTEPPLVKGSSCLLPETTNIYDPYEENGGSEKTVKNVFKTNTVYDASSMRNITLEEGAAIEVKNGIVYVKRSEKHKLAYMRYSHFNVSKPEMLKMPGFIPDINLVLWEERSEFISASACDGCFE